MKALKKVSAVILILAICVVWNHCFLTGYYNESVLYGSFTQKRERAESIESEKVIIIGGSASNLGFDSQYFQELSGKPAANLSVSASVPLKVYMQAAQLCAKPGDTIIMPLEYTYYASDFDEITEGYVDMVGVDTELKCTETLWNNMEFFTQSFLRSFTRINDCALFALKTYMKNENTIYTADSVNEYGDFCMHKDRPATYVSVQALSRFKYNNQTMCQIRDYIEAMREKGVTVYLTYPCVDKNYFADSEAYFAEVQQIVKRYIPEENIIGTPQDFVYDSDFFFDTAYHIRYENREVYTQALFQRYNEQ